MIKHNLSVIIPCYREKNRIAKCITESLYYLENCPAVDEFEIILVLDNAEDGTKEIIDGFLPRDNRLQLIDNPTRLRKGFSVRKGMLQGKYDILMFYDADLSTPLTEIEKFLSLIPEYDILIASRRMKASVVKKSRFKRCLSAVFSGIKKLLLGLPYKDTQCGFKMFRKRTKILFELQATGSSAFDVELLYLARKLNFKIGEIPVTWTDSAESNFSWWRVVPRFLKDIIKIRLGGLKTHRQTRERHKG